MQEENTSQSTIVLEGDTYEIIQNRLQKQKNELQTCLSELNTARTDIFGSVETKLIANNRINTENNCIARDIVTIGSSCLFGYNVHFGLRTEIKLEDVFSVYLYEDEHFVAKSLDLINDDVFKSDFLNLYKYYRNVIFSKFSILGNYLHMVFQLSESVTDIKTFKWLINENSLSYVDNRSEHEFKFPTQYDFYWIEVSREMHRYGKHPHISILDKIFVETIGGDLTIKIENNTEEGKGVYDEPVAHPDQTLDDGQYRYADLGNLIVLEIKPFQEDARYFVYNHKLREVKKIDSIKDAAIVLPDDQGILYHNGFYLQSGENKLFENDVQDVKFLKKIASPNGEDYFYVFYQSKKGLYILMTYNVIDQEVNTPIICNGYTILKNGELCYFKTEDEQTKHHVIQIWQTPFITGELPPSEHSETLIYKIGNKDIVKAMAECHSLINLLNKKDNYSGLYDDLVKQSTDILDSYYWIREPETKELNIPLAEINKTANSAIDEFEKVVQLRKNAKKAIEETSDATNLLFNKIKSSSFKSIEEFVEVLAKLRGIRGEVIGLNDIRYVDKTFIESLEAEIAEYTEKISHRCVTFLLDDKALLPYRTRVAQKEEVLTKIKKVLNAKKLAKEVNQIAQDLEMLIDIVSNLQIEDTSHSTKIIDTISLIFSTLNQLKSGIKKKITSLGSTEAAAEFASQLKLVDQSIINYLDIAHTPEKVDELLNKISLQLETLEGRFSSFDAFILVVSDKREEVYNAFDARKNSLIDAQNKKAIALEKSANRILKGVNKKALSFNTLADINGYFASDLMILKIKDIVEQLTEMEDISKAEMIETLLKTSKEDATRSLKDKKELYEDGENIIKLGKHKFRVNKQVLDLSIVYRDGILQYHLSGTDFYGKIDNPILEQSKKYWNQEFVSENKEIYRSAYLAYKIFKNNNSAALSKFLNIELLEKVKEESSKNYTEGYVKGVHDEDASAILKMLLTKNNELGLLKYTPQTRAFAQYFWNTISDESKSYWSHQLNAAGEVLVVFPESESYVQMLEQLEGEISAVFEKDLLAIQDYSTSYSTKIAGYLFSELQSDTSFCISLLANELFENLVSTLNSASVLTKIKKRLANLDTVSEKINLSKQWVSSFVQVTKPELIDYTHEIVCLLLFNNTKNNVISVYPNEIIKGLKGSHLSIKNDEFVFNYHEFTNTLEQFSTEEVSAFVTYRKVKHDVIDALKQQVKLHEFEPKVLSSFVRNKLINEVYLPLFGDNLAKQLGTVGDEKRTDRMGMLLLVSPPGYGKTTLMEYMANRLGLVFMKINGPAIGHEVTSVDPMSATNATAKAELEKLNLAFEMGNNVMLYLDDIQHCNPEFLQKFISLADGTRKIEGVFKGAPKTYDLRAKKFCVIMAGNPYTESGDRFQIPDMLANRADIYNLGDIIGDTADLFKLSLIENSLTSNPILHQLSSRYFDDIYGLIAMVENGSPEGIKLDGNHTKQEVQDYLSILSKVVTVRDRVMRVNKNYIKSAAMEDSDRTEPSFKLQGSYRDMNKLVAKVVPIMNEKELESLLLSHYVNESQTLTNAAEANLLKYKELADKITPIEKRRWETIKTTFVKNNKLKGFGNKNDMGQVLSQMMSFNDSLEGIQEVLKEGLSE